MILFFNEDGEVALSLNKLRPGYILRPRGKNNKIVYYLRCAARYFVPSIWLRRHKAALLASLDSRQDKEQILDRVEYYNKLTGIRELSGQTYVRDITNRNDVYNRDTFEFTRYFDRDLLLDTHFGDWTELCDTPSIVKTRPLAGDNSNDVILNLDKVRHFTFLKDKRSFDSKWDKAIFRGAAYQPHRKRFMQAFFGNPLVDCGDTAKRSFMEGRLQGGVHYIEIKDDYSDLEEKIRYYSTHPEEAKAIIRNAHAFVDQFRDKEREELISLLVLEKYFRHTRQS